MIPLYSKKDLQNILYSKKRMNKNKVKLPVYVHYKWTTQKNVIIFQLG